MEKKSLFILVFIAVFTFVFLTPQAQAGPEERYRWEGIAIGLGAAIIGSAILHNHYQSHHPKYAVYHKPAKHKRHDFRRHHHRRGHWEIQKEWVPPTYRRVWNPGHYNRRGRWIPGQWMEIVDQPGYWVKKKVWVRRYR
jgi:hypothetical protein